ncbi:hypothetical protein KAT21_00705 [Candidatus Bathyarchaeota archaeon]|nr:hypothetical protein [Candidatus Bathyarchaeota archaeon]MCK4668626.1 hypothetical protein [Candidatus Bathyarchaeota archaeon]
MSTVQTEQAKQPIRRFPSKFSKGFEKNKQAVSILIQEVTPKIRNRVAEEITHVFAGKQIAFLDENVEENKQLSKATSVSSTREKGEN